MPLKKAKKAWYDEAAVAFGFKYDRVSDRGNVICKKLTAKSRKALKDAGYLVKCMPNGTFVVCHK